MTNLTTPNPKDVSPWPDIMRYGLISGIIFIAVFMLGNLTGLSSQSSLMGSLGFLLVNIIIIVGVCVWAVRSHREQSLGGYISFGRAFLVGFGVLFLAMVLQTFFTYVYVTMIDPGYADDIVKNMSEMMENMGAAEAEIEKQVKAAQERFTPAGLIKQGAISTIVGSLIFSLISAAILKKNRPVVEDILDEN
ncbi:MAG: DUF4199 domain-containing protein [Bacteroidetes bacterium]|nr:DUF4199 domain-containing protein [Bacteroidota bacterium]